MKKLSNQKGFHLIIIPLIVVILAIIGFTGWYVYKTNSNTNNTYSSTSSQIVSTPTPSICKSSPTPTPTASVTSVTYPGVVSLEDSNRHVTVKLTNTSETVSFDYPVGATVSKGTYGDYYIEVHSADKKYSMSLLFSSGKGFEGTQRIVEYTAQLNCNRLVVTKSSDVTNPSFENQPTQGYIVWANLINLNTKLQGIMIGGTDVSGADGAMTFFEKIANSITFN
jgi:hypothetical protein